MGVKRYWVTLDEKQELDLLIWADRKGLITNKPKEGEVFTEHQRQHAVHDALIAMVKEIHP